MRTVALCAGFPGVLRVLEETERLGLLTLSDWGFADVPPPPADHYLIGAWHPIYAEALPKLDAPITVLWTSSAGEMGLEPVEQGYFRALLANPRITRIWVGDPALGGLHRKVFHAPYPLVLNEGAYPLHAPNAEPAFGLFAPGTLKKNLPNQLLGAKRFQEGQAEPWTFHTNVPLTEDLATFAPARRMVHAWLPRADYLRLLASLRVTLHASWCETFCYAAAESLLCGTPVVASYAVPFLSPPNLAHAGSPTHIAHMLAWTVAQPWVLPAQRADLLRYAQRANACLVGALQEHGVV